MDLTGSAAKRKFFTKEREEEARKTFNAMQEQTGGAQYGEGFFSNLWSTIKRVATVIYKAGKAVVSFVGKGIMKLSGWLEDMGIKKSDQAAFLSQLASKSQYGRVAKVLLTASKGLKLVGKGAQAGGRVAKRVGIAMGGNGPELKQSPTTYFGTVNDGEVPEGGSPMGPLF